MLPAVILASMRRMRRATPRLLVLLLATSTAASAQALIDDVPGKSHFASSPLQSFRRPLAGDFDRDGDLDVVAYDTRLGLRLHQNDGSAVFADASAGRFPAVKDVTSLATGDADGDGDLDLVVAGYGQTQLFANGGTGIFTDVTATAMPADSATDAIALGDVDGDGDLDLVRATTPTLPIAVYANNGRGVFTARPATQPPLPVNANVLRLADVDGDRDLDLVIGLQGAQAMLFANNGTGSFIDVTALQMPAIGLWVSDLGFADADRDGDLDLLLSVGVSGQNRLYLNNGRGVFTDGTLGRLPARVEASGTLALADLDNDGDVDLEWSTYYAPRLAINNGAGTFSEVTSAQLQASAHVTESAAGDFDNDGDVDVAWTSPPPRPLKLHLNVGRASIVDVEVPTTPQLRSSPTSLAGGDVNGDGYLDVVVGNGSWVPSAPGYTEALLLGDGHGRLVAAPAASLPAVYDDTRVVLLGDLSGDGNLDLVCGNEKTTVQLLLGDGKGRFTNVTSTHVPPAIFPITAALLADLDRDGDRDLLAGGFNQAFLLQNDGRGRLTDVTRSVFAAPPPFVGALATGDVDLDGDLDVVMGTGRGLLLFLNDGSGRLTQAQLGPSTYNVTGLTLADVDRDRDLDVIALAACVNLFLNDGRGVFSLDATRLPHTPSCPPLRKSIAFDADVDGDLDLLLAGSSQYLYANDGRGFFTDATLALITPWPIDTRDALLADLDGDQDLDVITAPDDYWSCRVLHNRARHLATPWAARTGRAYRLDVFGWAGIAAAPQAALPLVSLGQQTPPLDLGPWGRLHLALPTLIVGAPVLLPAPLGAASVQFPLPNAPALIGATIHGQALVVHQAAQATWRLTNLISDRVLQ
jgi:hypothetical protein